MLHVKGFSMRGFTLIELLIVMAIIGILAAVVLVGIDPVDKINAANDTKVQRDINALANAMESYAAINNGTYATTQAQLVTNGDLKAQLTAPAGYTAYTLVGGVTGEAHGQVKSKRFVNATPSTPSWAWCSSSGRAGAVASMANGTCP